MSARGWCVRVCRSHLARAEGGPLCHRLSVMQRQRDPVKRLICIHVSCKHSFILIVQAASCAQVDAAGAAGAGAAPRAAAALRAAQPLLRPLQPVRRAAARLPLLATHAGVQGLAAHALSLRGVERWPRRCAGGVLGRPCRVWAAKKACSGDDVIIARLLACDGVHDRRR